MSLAEQFGYDLDGDERVEEGLRRENSGISIQRRQAIKDRWPQRAFAFEREGGVLVRARVGIIYGARV